MIDRFVAQYNNIALYGLGTETERFLAANPDVKIVGLLDGFRTDGKMFGYPIHCQAGLV